MAYYIIGSIVNLTVKQMSSQVNTKDAIGYIVYNDDRKVTFCIPKEQLLKEMQSSKEVRNGIKNAQLCITNNSTYIKGTYYSLSILPKYSLNGEIYASTQALILSEIHNKLGNTEYLICRYLGMNAEQEFGAYFDQLSKQLCCINYSMQFNRYVAIEKVSSQTLNLIAARMRLINIIDGDIKCSKESLVDTSNTKSASNKPYTKSSNDKVGKEKSDEEVKRLIISTLGEKQTGLNENIGPRNVLDTSHFMSVKADDLVKQAYESYKNGDNNFGYDIQNNICFSLSEILANEAKPGLLSFENGDKIEAGNRYYKREKNTACLSSDAFIGWCNFITKFSKNIPELITPDNGKEALIGSPFDCAERWVGEAIWAGEDGGIVLVEISYNDYVKERLSQYVDKLILDEMATTGSVGVIAIVYQQEVKYITLSRFLESNELLRMPNNNLIDDRISQNGYTIGKYLNKGDKIKVEFKTSRDFESNYILQNSDVMNYFGKVNVVHARLGEHVINCIGVQGQIIADAINEYELRCIYYDRAKHEAIYYDANCQKFIYARVEKFGLYQTVDKKYDEVFYSSIKVDREDYVMFKANDRGRVRIKYLDVIDTASLVKAEEKSWLRKVLIDKSSVDCIFVY